MMRHTDNCRLCGGIFFSDRLILSPTPLANELSESAEIALDVDIFPLTLAMCSECSHVQLTDLVVSKRLFDNYSYQSGTSAFFRKHFSEFASTTVQFAGLKPILEIGSNDGTLLQAYTDLGYECVGIEPSVQLVEQCVDDGLIVRAGYFDSGTVQQLISEFGQLDLVVANNVLAHIDNLRQTFRDIYACLSPNGVCVFEVAHLLNMVAQGTFDSIYHEHMSYHSVFSLTKFCQSIGFTPFDIQLVDSHGGSIRMFISKNPTIKISNSVEEILKKELAIGLDQPLVLNSVKDRISKIRLELDEFFSLTKTHTDILTIGFGAPAKLVTFISETRLYEQKISFIVDENPLKQGKFIPKWAIPVIGKSEAEKKITNLITENPDILIRVIIFPWNLSSEIIEKLIEWLPRGSQLIWFNDGLKVREII